MNSLHLILTLSHTVISLSPLTPLLSFSPPLDPSATATHLPLPPTVHSARRWVRLGFSIWSFGLQSSHFPLSFQPIIYHTQAFYSFSAILLGAFYLLLKATFPDSIGGCFGHIDFTFEFKGIFRFSGITCELLNGVTTSLKEIQEDFLKLVYKETILVGHSLENDLLALNISHGLVLDTAVLYKHPRGASYKTALIVLARKFLFQEI